ncbi:S9 family peptidase [Paenibacillus sp. OV219]|uniref:alpha/beta hydrolase family protein n=1 Tax=Paenibacillus sp. OV219 TaxID=1884377 RepID=UPI0008C31BE1|nr:acetylxylan esterase [Paenibacillus sp. OV219]SEN87097.1 Acetyl xylan esterase (AXE1) [Paenibacillus sp. OV219]
MRNYSLQEEQANRRRELSYIEDYPDIERFHKHPFRRYLDQRNTEYLVKRKTALRQVNDKAAAFAYQARIREVFRASVGPLPAGADGGGSGNSGGKGSDQGNGDSSSNGSGSASASAYVTGTLDFGSYLIDKVCIETMPGIYATGSFYYPKERSGGEGELLPALLLLCGHSNEGKAHVTYVSFCVEAVMTGFCVLTFDPVGQGERRVRGAGVEEGKEVGEDDEGSEGSGSWLDPVAAHCFLDQKLSLLGEHLGAYMMQENVAALTYLLARPEVDAARVGVTGNSGGGTMSAYMGAYDDRVKAVAPCCYITELRSMLYRLMAQDAEQCLPGFMARGLDHSDLVTAAAPKPYHIGAAMFDFFPIDGVRDAFIEAKKLYRLLDAEEQLELHVVMKGHGFWQEMREQVLRFFCRTFGVEWCSGKAVDYDRLPSEIELCCFAANGGKAAGLACGSLLDVIQERVRSLPAKQQPEQNGAEIREQLSGLLQLRHDGERNYSPLEPDRNGGISFESEDGMIITGIFHRWSSSEADDSRRIWLAIGGMKEAELERARCSGYDAVLIIHPRGTGPAAMEPGCTFGMFEPELASGYNARMLGQSLQGMRVTDALAAIDCLKQTPGCEQAEVTLYGQEEHALTALYAAVLSGGSSIHSLHVAGLLTSFRAFAEADQHQYDAGIIVPGLLLALDIPDLLQTLQSELRVVTVESWFDPMKRLAEPLRGS